MGTLFSTLNNKDGSVASIALLMLAFLTLMGISAATTTETEILISRNENLHKVAFYGADAGTELGAELLEQALEERDWSDDSVRGEVKIKEGDFYLNSNLASDETPSDTNTDAYFPSSYVAGSGDPHTYLRIGGNTQLSTGSAVQLGAGYEGKGKGMGGGGIWFLYDIVAQHEGKGKSVSRIHLQWRHVL